MGDDYALQQPVRGHILHGHIHVAASCETRVHARTHSLERLAASMNLKERIRFDGWRVLVWLFLLVVWTMTASLIIDLGRRDSESPRERLKNGKVVSRTISERFTSNLIWSTQMEKAQVCYKTDYLYKIPKVNGTGVNGSITSYPEFHQLEVSSLNYFVLFDRIGSSFLVWIASLIMDGFVIYYHIKNRPHPKFTLTGSGLSL